MKILFSIAILLNIHLISFCQNKTLNVGPRVKNVSFSTYDSTQNFLGLNYKKYLGQDLLVRPNLQYLKFGYRDFYKSPVLNNNSSKNIYAKNRPLPHGVTPYEDLVNRVFFVRDIINDGSKIFLKLYDRKNHENIYFNYSYDSEVFFPFVVIGYIEKLKKTNLHKDYYARFDKINELGLNPTYSDNENYNYFGSVWNVKDVFLNDSTGDIVCQLSSESNNLSVSIKHFSPKYFANKILYDEAKKYGLNVFTQVLRGFIDIGMDRNVVTLSIGNPKRINTTLSRDLIQEQWVYENGKYLYFTNGILKTIQY
ncbi:hypothetical protein [Sphingobacterium spiritivorum]|uniref:hypothetical protein n=1 Tax=Sphingobacterium spiritivorum TaxID=258 RepID=UPI003DA3A7C1